MDLDLKTWWSIAVTTVSFFGMIALALLSKTYAKREDLEKVVRKVDELQAQVDNLPTQKQVSDLLVEMANTRGEMKELRAQIQPVEHLSRLLLEQRLNDDK